MTARRTSVLAPALLAVLASLGLAACGGSTSDDGAADASPPPDYTDPKAGFDDAATQELVAMGYAKYFGKFTPSKVDDTEAYTLYTFDPDTKGPICMQGAPFKMSTRPGSSDDLIFYMQGGGACWTGMCQASTQTAGGPYPIGWTDGDTTRNPLGAFNLVSLGYCDGSVFSGENEVPDKDNGAPDGIRYHHGVQNLSAALDVAKRVFPNPRRIVLAGSSAGGYGTILGSAMIRLVYPKVDIFVIDDAGPGLTNPSTPSMWATIDKEWNLAPRIPAECTECKDGELTHLVAWELTHDPTLKFAQFSSYEDLVIGQGFLQMTGPDFKALLLKYTGQVHDAFPDRYERYLIAGDAHTALMAGYYDTKVNGVGLPEWTRRMLAGEAGWTDELQ